MKNSLVLAYLGDSIYEVYIRKYLIDKGIVKVNELQKESINYVSANSQAKYLKEMMDSNFLLEEEISIIKLARNHKNNHKPKNCDIITYKYATGFEALIGYWYRENNERLNYILEKLLKEILK